MPIRFCIEDVGAHYYVPLLVSPGPTAPTGQLSSAATVLERCARLGEVSEEPDRLVRRFATAAMREANDLVGGWMREAGLDVRRTPPAT